MSCSTAGSSVTRCRVIEHVRPARNQEGTGADPRPDRFVPRGFFLDFDRRFTIAVLAQDIPQGPDPLSRCDVHEPRGQVARKLVKVVDGLRRGRALPERSLYEHVRFPRCVVDRHVRPAVVILLQVERDAVWLEIQGAGLPDDRRNAEAMPGEASGRGCERARLSPSAPGATRGPDVPSDL